MMIHIIYDKDEIIHIVDKDNKLLCDNQHANDKTYTTTPFLLYTEPSCPKCRRRMERIDAVFSGESYDYSANLYEELVGTKKIERYGA